MPAWGVHFSGVWVSLPSFLPLGLLRPRETKETLIAFLGVCIVSAPFYGTAAASSQRGGGWGASTRDIPALPSLAVWPGISYLTFPSLCLFIYKAAQITTPMSLDCPEAPTR